MAQGADERGAQRRDLSQQQLQHRAVKHVFVPRCQQQLGIKRSDALPGRALSHILRQLVYG